MTDANTASRPLLESKHVRPGAKARIAAFHPEVIAEVRTAVQSHPIVVVGMAQNPHVKKVRQALKDANVDFTYLEYGSYLSKWRERLAIKLWSGWPTFPQVFAKGELVGGEELTLAALADGSLKDHLAK